LATSPPSATINSMVTVMSPIAPVTNCPSALNRLGLRGCQESEGGERSSPRNLVNDVEIAVVL